MLQYKVISLLIFSVALISHCANREIRKGSQNKDTVSTQSTEDMNNQQSEMQQGKKTLVLQGIFDSSGNTLIRIDKPTLHNRQLSRPTPDQREGRYFALINYSTADSLKVYFDGLVSGDRVDERRHGFWEIQVPVKDEKIMSVKIIEARTRRLLAEFNKDDILQN
jgi:hypothetical protein